MYARGHAQGLERRDHGVNILLGPVASPLGRSPAGGRYWEGFGPDPVLTGIAFSQTIKGIQDAGVVACAKHFIGNEQEHFRMGPEAREVRIFRIRICARIAENISSTVSMLTRASARISTT